MMFQAVLGNPGHPEYGVATIPFPIPHDQYAHCMHDSFSTALTSSGIRLSCWRQPSCSIT